MGPDRPDRHSRYVQTQHGPEIRKRLANQSRHRYPPCGPDGLVEPVGSRLDASQACWTRGPRFDWCIEVADIPDTASTHSLDAQWQVHGLVHSVAEDQGRAVWAREIVLTERKQDVQTRVVP